MTEARRREREETLREGIGGLTHDWKEGSFTLRKGSREERNAKERVEAWPE